MAKDNRIQSGILGDINPKPGTEDHVASRKDSASVHESEESMVGGSQHDRTQHSGSREITEGVTGAVCNAEDVSGMAAALTRAAALTPREAARAAAEPYSVARETARAVAVLEGCRIR